MKTTVGELKRKNRKAVNCIKNFKPAGHTIHNKVCYNSFFQELLERAVETTVKIEYARKKPVWMDEKHWNAYWVPVPRCAGLFPQKKTD